MMTSRIRGPGLYNGVGRVPRGLAPGRFTRGFLQNVYRFGLFLTPMQTSRYVGLHRIN